MRATRSLYKTSVPPFQQAPETVLCLGDRGGTAGHGACQRQDGIAGVSLVLEAVGETAAAYVLEDRSEARLEGARDSAEERGGAVILGGVEEPRLAEAPEDALHLAGHVHLHDEGLGRQTGLAPHRESGWTGRPHWMRGNTSGFPWLDRGPCADVERFRDVSRAQVVC